jgi:NAD(P)-dependent dehydrogenase (short-subunit alcohol dehydrogenase family)
MVDDFHAVVTGGGSGIGIAIARMLAETGYKVTIMGRDRGRLEEAARQLPGGNAILCDVSSQASIAKAFALALEQSGPIATLVNNAGMVRTAPFSRQTDGDWDQMWRTNVLGCVYATREVLGPMRKLPAGRIINIASTAALKGYAYSSAYCATKHALLGLTRSLALELANTRITANAICPGYADTRIVSEAIATIVEKTGRTADQAKVIFTGANPQGRLIEPDEVAQTVRWLVSDAARSITGQAVAVAGGEVM